MLRHGTQFERGTREYRRANLALFIAGFVTFSTLYAVQPLLPLLVVEFGIAPATASLACGPGCRRMLTNSASRGPRVRPARIAWGEWTAGVAGGAAGCPATGVASVSTTMSSSVLVASASGAAVSVSSTSAKLTPSSFGDAAFGAAGSGRAAGLEMMSAAEVTPVHIPTAPAITDAEREKSVQPASQ